MESGGMTRRRRGRRAVQYLLVFVGCVLVIKTTADRVPALEARIREIHPYDLPECLVVPATGGSAAYLAWVGDAVQGRPT